MTKKVFSGYKFLEMCLSQGETDEIIMSYFESWANRCEGLTEQEMNRFGFYTSDNWMEEVEE